ncbi:MAG: nucleotidyltransferase domain-containing protein [Candidatus Altiarchaeota archaeon]
MFYGRNIPAALMRSGLEDRLLRVCEEEDLSYLALFGSYARGKAKPRSDLDIAIEYEKGADKTLFDLISLEERLRRPFRRKVDLGIHDTISPHVIDNVRKDMRVIYQRLPAKAGSLIRRKLPS